MSCMIDKPDFAAHIYQSLSSHATVSGKGTDGMQMLLLLSGVLIETLLLFDEPDEALEASIAELSKMMACEPSPGRLGSSCLPPSCIIDDETEHGRRFARFFFEDWLNCAYEFHDLHMFVTHNVLLQMEGADHPRDETLRLFIECASRCLAYEIAAQELCDIVIEQKIGQEGWTLNESIRSLSAMAGRRLALAHNGNELFDAPALPEKLNRLAYVMSQEAIRMGIVAGSDWRFALAANDYLMDDPFDLLASLEPQCRAFFGMIGLHDLHDQAVACAKSAGRMLAVTSGGDRPELEPAIAKPLAMAAMTGTYRHVCQEEVILSC
jgi:hypothetical protein